MKSYKIARVYILFCFIFWGLNYSFGEEIILRNPARSSGITLLEDEVKEDGNGTIKFGCSIEKIYYYDASTPRGDFTVLYVPEFYFGGEYGAPQLPVITKLVQIPFGAKVKVTVKGFEAQEYDLSSLGIRNKVYPRQPSAPKDGTEVPFVYNKSAYIHKAYVGMPMASFQEIGIMRHMRLGLLTIAPVKYNAVDNKIEVYQNMEIELTIENADIIKTREVYDRYYSKAFEPVEKLVYVPKSLQNEKKNNMAEGYLIVTPEAFLEALSPFIELKKEKGYNVKVITIEQFGTGGSITENLKQYIHDLYINPSLEFPAPTYVLFVGDHEQVPAFKGKTGSHITELYYVAVTPNDFLPDILTGRFSAQNLDQLIPQIEKTVYYEKGQFEDPTFIKRAVLIAGWDSTWAKSHGWPHINYATKYYFNFDSGFEKVSSFLSSGSHQNEKEIISSVAEGVAYVNYTAHGSPSSWADPTFTIQQVYALGNKGKYPFVVGNCCVTSKFDVATCFAEAWLRAKDAGAIGYVGGTNNTYWDEDFWWGVGLHSIVKPNPQGVPPLKENTGRGALDSLFEDVQVSNGAFYVVGNMAVQASTSTRKQYYWEVYHLMGDPSIVTRLAK